jgi:hypothetical protein
LAPRRGDHLSLVEIDLGARIIKAILEQQELCVGDALLAPAQQPRNAKIQWSQGPRCGCAR